MIRLTASTRMCVNRDTSQEELTVSATKIAVSPPYDLPGPAGSAARRGESSIPAAGG